MNEEPIDRTRAEETDASGFEPDAEFAALLKDFRSALTHVALRESSRPHAVIDAWLGQARRRERRRLMSLWSTGVAVVAVLVLLAVMLPAYLRGPRMAPDAVTASAATAAPNQSLEQNQASTPAAVPVSAQSGPTAESDSALLEAVDTDISASAPPALAPLATMEEWDATPDETVSVSVGNGAASSPMENANGAH